MNTSTNLSADLVFREATLSDLEQIVGLLSDDLLGAKRERESDDKAYLDAFQQILENPRARILVLEQTGRVVACAQLDLIPNLSLSGALRGQIEGVRVASDLRSQGIGHLLIQKLIELCREAGCRLVQLTVDRTRQEAHAFYEDIGFRASHTGFKLLLG